MKLLIGLADSDTWQSRVFNVNTDYSIYSLKICSVYRRRRTYHSQSKETKIKRLQHYSNSNINANAAPESQL